MTTILDQLRAALVSRPDIELAVLFGSAAHGGLRSSSDVDIAVRWQPPGPADRDALLAELERIIGRTIDLVDLDSAPPQLRFEIARTGVVLTERTRDLWPMVRARAFVDWWDFGPIARRIHRAAVARLRKSVNGPP